MARRIIINAGLFFAILFACIACTSSLDKSEIAELIEIDYPMGKEVILEQIFPAYYIEIHNLSDQCILFPVDYNIKLFMKNGDQVAGIKNSVIYHGNEIKLSSKGTYFADNVISFKPDLKPTDYSPSTRFYATIQGHLCNDKSIQIDKSFEFSVK